VGPTSSVAGTGVAKSAILLPSSSTNTPPSSGASSDSGAPGTTGSTEAVKSVSKGDKRKKGDDSSSFVRHRRSSALLPAEGVNKLSRRHGSSGCLSKHCTSLQQLNRSSSALNKMQSRSMNLLTFASSTADQLSSAVKILSSDGSSTDEGFDPDSERQKKPKPQRPRSYSTRAAKEADIADIHVPKVDDGKRRQKVVTKTTNGQSSDNMSSNVGVNGGQNGNVQQKSANSKQSSKVYNKGQPGSGGGVKCAGTEQGAGTVKTGAAKKVPNPIPMLGVFLEGLTSSSTSDSKKKQKQEAAKKSNPRNIAAALGPSPGNPSGHASSKHALTGTKETGNCKPTPVAQTAVS